MKKLCEVCNTRKERTDFLVPTHVLCKECFEKRHKPKRSLHEEPKITDEEAQRIKAQRNAFLRPYKAALFAFEGKQCDKFHLLLMMDNLDYIDKQILYDPLISYKQRKDIYD